MPVHFLWEVRFEPDVWSPNALQLTFRRWARRDGAGLYIVVIPNAVPPVAGSRSVEPKLYVDVAAFTAAGSYTRLAHQVDQATTAAGSVASRLGGSGGTAHDHQGCSLMALSTVWHGA